MKSFRRIFRHTAIKAPQLHSILENIARKRFAINHALPRPASISPLAAPSHPTSQTGQSVVCVIRPAPSFFESAFSFLRAPRKGLTQGAQLRYPGQPPLVDALNGVFSSGFGNPHGNAGQNFHCLVHMRHPINMKRDNSLFKAKVRAGKHRPARTASERAPAWRLQATNGRAV